MNISIKFTVLFNNAVTFYVIISKTVSVLLKFKIIIIIFIVVRLFLSCKILVYDFICQF